MVDFKAPLLQINGHLQTILPSLFRKITINYTKERLDLPDGDFVMLNWALTNNSTHLKKHKPNSKKLVIVTHGLEGDSSRHYVTGMVKVFIENGYDGLGWDCRSCSGEMNLLPRFYHHGDAQDLRLVVQHAIEFYKYEEIVLVGFSMGGSLTIRALAEKPEWVPNEVKKAIAASVPIDLPSSVAEMCKPGKRFYMKRFLNKLHVKLKQKAQMFPENPILNVDNFEERIKDFYDFDSTYTAPLHGYENAIDFYNKASVKPILPHLKTPVLLIQALNDPFLSDSCFETGTQNPNLELLLSLKGGHVGFELRDSKCSFVELKAIEFALNKKEAVS